MIQLNLLNGFLRLAKNKMQTWKHILTLEKYILFEYVIELANLT